MSDGLQTNQATRSAAFIESAVVFLIGYLAMSFFMPSEGLPGNDSYYHVKMALMMPEVGLVEKFPWLQYSYFTKDSDDFVSHHYGFHALLIPFVNAGQWLVNDDLAGARWAICTFFGLAMAFFHSILRGEKVPWRMLWVLLFLAMPIQFYTRHAYIRAISPSLFAMFVLVWAMFRGRWLIAGIVVLLFNHMYLGAVMYSPVIVASFALANVLGVPEDRKWPWKMVAATAIGWFIGILTHPYCGNMFEFLRLQVFGTGLTPDIEVGSEWKPYSDIWWFAVLFAGPILAIWCGSLVTRLRLGPRLTANELTLVLLHFAFLVLTLKARRFIEYWPAFCLLSSAVLAKPALEAMRDWLARDLTDDSNGSAMIMRIFWSAAGLGLAAWLVTGAVRHDKVGPALKDVIQSWRFWTAVVAGLYLPVLLEFLRTERSRPSRVAAVLWLLPLAFAATTFVTVASSIMWKEIRKSCKCSYDVPKLTAMMDAIRADSKPGDIIFTSDWDDFPLHFYYNNYNHYIVGLDPKFTHDRRPDLWERFVRITRAQTPTTSTVKMKDSTGKEFKEKLDIRVEDIRDVFKARYVISDRDHKALSNKVMGAKGFAELLYPVGEWKKNQNAQYVVFKILDAPVTTGPATSGPSLNR